MTTVTMTFKKCYVLLKAGNSFSHLFGKREVNLKFLGFTYQCAHKNQCTGMSVIVILRIKSENSVILVILTLWVPWNQCVFLKNGF